MIVEKIQPLKNYEEYLSSSLQNFVSLSEWTDYHWQLNNSIKTVADFENFTGINFSKKEHAELEKTIRKFPFSVTPYYASLIDPENFRNDPIFKQAFPNP